MGRRRFCWIQGAGQVTVLFIVDRAPDFEVWLAGSEFEPFLVTTLTGLGILNGVTFEGDFITREVYGLPRTHPGDSGTTGTIKQSGSIAGIFFRGLISANNQSDYYITLMSDGNEIDDVTVKDLYPQISKVHYIMPGLITVYNFDASLSNSPDPASADVINADDADWRKSRIDAIFSPLGATNPSGTGLGQGLSRTSYRIGDRVFTFSFVESELLAGSATIGVNQLGVGEISTHEIDITAAFAGDMAITPDTDVLICSVAYYE